MPAGLLATMMAGHGVLHYGTPLLIHLMTTEYGWPRLAGSVSFSAMWVMVAAMAPLVGALVPRVGPKRLMVAGGLLIGSAFASLALVQSAPHLVASLMLAGMGSACAGLTMSTTVIVANSTPEARGGRTGFITLGLSLAGVLIPYEERICEFYGWRVGAIIVGCFAAAVILPVALGLIPSKLRPVADTQGQTGAGACVSAGAGVVDVPGVPPGAACGLVEVAFVSRRLRSSSLT